jgi:hypothetical protein
MIKLDQWPRNLSQEFDPTFLPDGKITSDSKAIAALLRFRHHRFG